MKHWWPLLTLLGCNPKVEEAPPCQGWKAEDEDYRPVLEILSDDGESIRIQAVFSRMPRTPDGAPTVVYVQGGWAPVMLPLEEKTPTLRDDMGFTTLYMDFPAANFRGEESRDVLAHVLRYAAGEITDTDDCTIDDRVPGGRSPEIVLAGFSNGGNLAWATAGDLDLDVPRIDGIATFETPSSSQFIMVEPGTRRHPNARFDLDTCAVVTGPAISCGVDYAPIDFAQHNLCEATEGCLYIDLNDDGDFTDQDVIIGGVSHPELGGWVHSVPATVAAEDAQVLPDSRTRSNDARAFWRSREAPRSMADAVDRFPELAGIATGTRVDHVLDNLDRPVHVTGLVQSMQHAGVVWSRLHADASYMEELHGTSKTWVEYPANEAIILTDERWKMQPEDDHDVRGSDYLTASVLELIDRSRALDWSNDVTETLQMFP
ncbi:MAG: hypothetical protein CL930_14505 [Deltaproteobacteria bacterium]|nr:hypothetical protein [Deltaproteobacteria bacterium]